MEFFWHEDATTEYLFSAAPIDPGEFPSGGVMTVEEFDAQFLKSCGIEGDAR